MLKKFLIGSLYLFLILTFLCTSISYGTEKIEFDIETETENQNVKAAYTSFVELQKAMDERNFDDLIVYLNTLEDVTGAFDDADNDEFARVISKSSFTIEEYFQVIDDASKIRSIDNYYKAFCADKNMKTAWEFVNAYTASQKICKLIGEMRNDIIDVYNEEIIEYIPSENVIFVIDGFEQFSDALESREIEFLKLETNYAKEVIDTMSELSYQELQDLTLLLDLGNAMETCDKIKDCMNNAINVVSVYEAYTEYLENPNVETATSFIDIIDNYDNVCNDRTLLENFSLFVDDTYRDALFMVSSPNVVEVYDYFIPVQETLSNGNIEELKNTVNNMKDKINIFNELSNQELAQLAALLDVSNGEEAYSVVLSGWVDANIIINIYDTYTAYLKNSNEETATAFVELIDGYNDMYDDRILLETFFSNIDNDYTLATTLVDKTDEKDNTSNNITDTNTENTNKDNTNTNNEISKNSVSSGSNPQTSDNIFCFLGILFISLLGVIVTSKYIKYSNKK